MKTILQKHKSKFVVNLLNGLGVVACVSLTACDNKDKQTYAQVEKLKDEKKKEIQKWVNKLSGLNNAAFNNLGDDLKEKVAQKCIDNKIDVESDLEISLTLDGYIWKVSEEKQKKINEWLDKLNGLNNASFDGLSDSLKKKVVQNFIDSKVNIINNSEINIKLGGFVAEVLKEKKESEVVLEVEGEGIVSITNVADGKTNNFDLGAVKGFQNFFEALKDKKITRIGDDWSFVFDKDSVKICGHETGFKLVDDNFENFVKCLVRLSKVNGFKLPDLSLRVDKDKLFLNEVDCSSVGFCKESEFWNLVKDNATLFRIGDNDKFEIKKNSTGDNATVKIGDFVTSLKWSDVIKTGDKGDIVDSGWGNIFKFDSVNIKFHFCGFDFGFDKKRRYIHDLMSLREFVELFSDKNVVVDNIEYFRLSFWSNGSVRVCGGRNFNVLNNSDFDTFLECISILDEKKFLGNNLKIKIEGNNSVIILNNSQILYTSFVKKTEFWSAVKKYKGLFEGLPIKVSKGFSNKKGEIGSDVLDFGVFDDGGNIKKEWNGVFKKKI